VQTEKSGTLGTENDQTIFCLATQQGGAELRTDDRAPTLTAAAGMSGNNQPVVAIPTAYSFDSLSSNSMTSKNQGGIAVLCLNNQGGNVMGVSHDVSGTLREQEHGHQPSILDMSHACDIIRDCGKVAPSLQAKESGGQSLNLNNTIRQNMVVRRLTPLECTRLQGYPDGWVDIGDWTDEKGKKHKDADSPKYKALGNSIALPFWNWMLRRMAWHLPKGATLGSLFDGIGGFSLIWERIHGRGTARWASEIEAFPIAVTKKHFSEEE
jgi:DNA (cytosine-5)-methyltransferase 1